MVRNPYHIKDFNAHSGVTSRIFLTKIKVLKYFPKKFGTMEGVHFRNLNFFEQVEAVSSKYIVEDTSLP